MPTETRGGGSSSADVRILEKPTSSDLTLMMKVMNLITYSLLFDQPLHANAYANVYDKKVHEGADNLSPGIRLPREFSGSQRSARSKSELPRLPGYEFAGWVYEGTNAQLYGLANPKYTS